MARKEVYKTVQVPQDVHEQVAKIADELGLSLAKATEALLRTQITAINNTEGSLGFHIQKNDNGGIDYTIVKQKQETLRVRDMQWYPEKPEWVKKMDEDDIMFKGN